MARDYSRQRVARNGRSSRNAPAPWGWLLSGVVIGATFSFLVCLAMQKPPSSPQSVAGQSSAKATSSRSRNSAAATPDKQPQAAKPAPSVQPQFDFYDILRDKQNAAAGRGTPAQGATATAEAVDVPEPPPAAKATVAAKPPSAPAPGTTPAAAPPSGTLSLQAGAFARADDANHRRGELLLLGYDARIETVRLPDGQTRHRVLVGPFANPQALSAARRALHDVGIETL